MSDSFSLFEFCTEIPPLQIVDVGASDTSEPPLYRGLVENGRAKVFAFEPNAEEREKLLALGTGGQVVLPHFVGDGRPSLFHETSWAATGSLFKPNTALLEQFSGLSDYMRPVATHPVQTTRLDDIPEIDDVDYLKMDVQGAELAVMRGGNEKLKSCLVVQTEVEFVEMYKEQPLFADVDSYLRSKGFSFHTFLGYGKRCFNPMRPKDPTKGIRQLLWAEAIYVRDFMNLDVLPDTKLAKLAIILHDIIGSPDLCLFVLQHLDRRGHTNFVRDYARRLQQNA